MAPSVHLKRRRWMLTATRMIAMAMEGRGGMYHRPNLKVLCWKWVLNYCRSTGKFLVKSEFSTVPIVGVMAMESWGIMYHKPVSLIKVGFSLLRELRLSVIHSAVLLLIKLKLSRGQTCFAFASAGFAVLRIRTLVFRFGEYLVSSILVLVVSFLKSDEFKYECLKLNLTVLNCLISTRCCLTLYWHFRTS